MYKRKKRLEHVRKRLLFPELEELEKFAIETRKEVRHLRYACLGYPNTNLAKMQNDPYLEDMPVKSSLQYQLECLINEKKGL